MVVWYKRAGIATNTVLAVLYTMVLTVCIVSWWRRYHPKTMMIKTFITLAGSGSIFRMAYFAIPNSVFKSEETPQDYDTYSNAFWLECAQSVLFMIPNVLFYGTYIIIVFFWAQAYSSLQRRKVKHHHFLRLYKIVMSCYAAIQVILIIVMLSANYFVFLLIHSVILCLLSLGASVSFVYFYRRLDTQLTSLFSARSTSDAVPPDAAGSAEQQRIDGHRRDKLDKIMKVAFTCAGTQTFRAAVLIFEMYVSVKQEAPKKYWWAIIGVYYVVSEIFVALAVLWILRQKPEAVVKHRSRRRSSKRLGGKAKHDKASLLTQNYIEEEDEASSDSGQYGTIDARCIHADVDDSSVNTTPAKHDRRSEQRGSTSLSIQPSTPSRPIHHDIEGSRDYTPSKSPERLPRADMDKNSLGYPSPGGERYSEDT
eukprot:gb/GECG01011348.1/.p1 GENE.gb/GECG01011348.1/~~gb/GECG01011348.1/.p1  ORF type:complete len:424 (+),score=35.18 gb/GECG01011348.1/:1-1272(+)